MDGVKCLGLQKRLGGRERNREVRKDLSSPRVEVADRQGTGTGGVHGRLN